MEDFENVFTPIALKNIQLKNRLIMAATGTNFNTPGGEVTEKLKRFLQLRAKGGIGLIVTESAYICDSGSESTYQLGINRDELITDLKNLTAMVHNEGAKIFLQLNHAGRQTFSRITGMELLAPSPVPCEIMRGIPRELDPEEIENLVVKFGESAKRARDAGFDGVEILAGHGHLINQFLSPYTNKREDSYGGSLEARMQFPLKVLTEVKRRAGKDFPISFRISAEEYVPGGLTLQDSIAFAQRLVKDGIDLLQISGGIYETRPMIVPPMLLPLELFAEQAQAIKQALPEKTPISLSGRIKDPYQAENLIKENKTDMVSMSRPLLADPFFPKKSKEGRVDDIRKCIACNQGCMDRFIIFENITCLGNPRCGYENERSIKKAHEQKRITIIGGGPGGMEAARIAALRGFEVYLFEKEKELGGQMRLAEIPPGKKEVKDLKDFLINQSQQLGVHINTGYQGDKKTIEEIDPAAIIMAAGSNPKIPDVPGVTQEHVYTAEEVLDQKIIPGERVMVVGGGLVGCETAYYIAAAQKYPNKKVILTETMNTLGIDIGPFYKGLLLSNIYDHAIDVYMKTTLKTVNKNSVLAEIEGEETEFRDIDAVVLAVGHEPNQALFDELSSEYEVYKIGDCNEVGKILDAIHEGFDCANNL